MEGAASAETPPCGNCREIPEEHQCQQQGPLPAAAAGLLQVGSYVGDGRLLRCPACVARFLHTYDDESGATYGLGYTHEGIRRLSPEAALRWVRGALHQRPDFRNERELVPEQDALLESLRLSPGLVDELVEQLSARHPARRIRAAERLGRIGRAARGAVPALCVALHDASRGVRFHVCWALGRIGSRTAIAALLAAVPRKPEAGLARALGRMGPGAVPGLLAQLESKETELVRVATWSLGLIGPADAAAAAPSLRSALREAQDDARARPELLQLRVYQVWSLARLGAASDVALFLRLLRSHADAVAVREALADALLHYGEEAAEPLAGALGDAAWALRWRAAEILGRLGSAGRAALPALKAARKDEREAVRTEATRSLKSIRKACRAER